MISVRAGHPAVRPRDAAFKYVRAFEFSCDKHLKLELT